MIVHPADKIYAEYVAVETLVHSLQLQQMRQGGGAGPGTFALLPKSSLIVVARQGGPLLYHKALDHTVTVDYTP